MLQESDGRIVEHGDFKIKLKLDERGLSGGFNLKYWVRHPSAEHIVYHGNKNITEPDNETLLDKAVTMLTADERRSVKEQVEHEVDELKQMLDDRGEQIIADDKEKLRQLNNLLPGEIPEERTTAYTVSYRTIPEEAEDEDFESDEDNMCAISARDLKENGVRNRHILPIQNENVLEEGLEKTEISCESFHHAVKVMEALEQDDVEDEYTEYNFIAEVLELFHDDYWLDERMRESDAKYDLDALVEKLKDNFPQEETE